MESSDTGKSEQWLHNFKCKFLSFIFLQDTANLGGYNLKAVVDILTILSSS